MAPSQTVTETLVIELAENSFNTFCDDISGMFGIDIRCNTQQVTHEKANGLKERFQELAVIYVVKAQGALNGTFHVVFDRQGLFILAGVVAMLPDQVILKDAKDGSLENAQKQTGILQEVGAAMVGSWDRIFRKSLDGHERFSQAVTFIGNPWDNPQESIGLLPDEQVSFVTYQMTVGFFPPFKCGIIFKKDFLTGTTRSNTEQQDSDQEKAQHQIQEQNLIETKQQAKETEEKPQEETEHKSEKDSQATAQTQTEETVQDTTEEVAQDESVTPEESAETQETEVADQDETVPTEEAAETQEPEANDEQKTDEIEQEPATTDEGNEQQERPISEAIKKLVQSPPVPSDKSTPPATKQKPALSDISVPLSLCAKDIMHKDVIWVNPEDSVQQALAKIQQNDSGYMMVGREQVLEGIVSKSDLTGALSPYLRSIFAKYRRPLDDATLQIKVKWIMTKTTNTAQQDTSLSTIMEKMCQTRLRCLPVVDQQNKVLGLITVFDVFKAFLNQTTFE